MLHRRARNRLAISSMVAAASALVACGQGEGEADTAPIVAPGEIAISRNHQGAQPQGAALIEIGQRELRLDHRPVLALERGVAPEAEIVEHVLTKLRQQIRTPARTHAALWVDANVPYATLAQVLRTLEVSSYREVSFAVRRDPLTADTGWMRLTNWRTVPPGDEPVTFEGRALPWSAFTSHWTAMADSCRAGQFIDCDAAPASIAEGGDLQVNLWTRGQGMKVTFLQVNAPPPPPEPELPPDPPPPPRPRGTAEEPAPLEAPPPPPATEGSFNFRHQASVTTESALSNTVQPVCGTQSCQVVVVGDASTATMRVVSFLGAFYANGFVEPDIAFRLPVWR